MNFIKRFYKSLYDFDEYDKMISQSLFKAVLNVLTITVIAVILLLIPFLFDYLKLGGITGAINKYVPDFTVENGILTTDKLYRNEVEKLSLIVIDTQNAHAEQELAGYESGFIITKDKMIIKSFSGDTVSQNYEIYEKFGIVNKAAVLKFVPIIKVYLVIIFFMFLGFMFLQYVFYAVIFAAMANIINIYIKASLKTADIFKLSCYAMSMPVLLKNVIASLNLMINTQFGFYMPSIVYFGLTGVYCYFILKAVKDKENREANRRNALL